MIFTAIDFETANASRGSACAVGLCTVENGQVVRCEHWLIRPEPCYFSPFNVEIHGIRRADVADAPTFAELWPELLERVSGPLVAHNAAFDMGVIRHSLDEAGLAYPSLDYYCTCVIAKRTWPDMTSHKLDIMARHLGISFQHHDAREDARACALVALEACRVHAANSLSDLDRLATVTAGCLYPGGYRPCRGCGRGALEGRSRLHRISYPT